MAHQRIINEIRKAEDLFSAHGEALSRDPEIRSLVAEYRVAIEKTGDSMRRTGVVEGCTACAAKGPGSCCFQGVEDGYDAVLLLGNLLLGVSLPRSADVPDSCFFVGSRGCKLSARYYFCLHYFCPDLIQLLGGDGVQRLLITIGQELSIGWNLEQALRLWLFLNRPAEV